MAKPFQIAPTVINHNHNPDQKPCSFKTLSTGNSKAAGREEQDDDSEKKKTTSLDPRWTQTRLNQNQNEPDRETELRHHPPFFPFPTPSSSNYAPTAGGGAAAAAAAGDIVEVQGGGHIVRSTGRKDRHSKVCTAKGLRDRRVRLSAHTAIQFYDVQDRLGYDRPSKAVDWLIKNAKPAIDRLAQLPPWRPPEPAAAEKSLLSSETGDYASAYGFCNSSSLLPPSLDSDSIADTIKSFFPVAASSSYQAEDLRLSLQSFQDPIFNQQQSRVAPAHQALLASAAPLAFEAGNSSWPEQGSYRGAAWNLVQNQVFAQWGTLQSSNPPSIRAMADPTALSSAFRPSSASSAPFFRVAASEEVGFSGYHIPARIQGGEEEHGGGGDAPRSASSASRH